MQQKKPKKIPASTRSLTREKCDGLLLFRVKYSLCPVCAKNLRSAEYARSQFRRSRNFWISSRNWSRDGDRIPVLFKGGLLQQVGSQNAAAVTSLLSSTPGRAGNHPQRLHKWHTGLPVQGRGDAYPSLQRCLSALVDTNMAAVVPERVMVREVGHWSNTTSLWAHQCSNWRNGSSHSVWDAKHWEHRCGEA
jgi:hypothetical protein